MPLATLQRLTPEDHETLAIARRDRVAANRPVQLAERKQLVATLSPPSPDEVKREAALASELEAAERAVYSARDALNTCLNRRAELRINSHGRSHSEQTRDQDAHARLRALAHPAVAFVEDGLQRALYDLCALGPSVVAIEHADEPIEPDDAEKRNAWFVLPRTRKTHTPIMLHTAQTELMSAIQAARQHVAALAYEDLDDAAVIARLRQEVDTTTLTRGPLALEHIRMDLAELRRKLNGSALDLWTIAEEVIE